MRELVGEVVLLDVGVDVGVVVVVGVVVLLLVWVDVSVVDGLEVLELVLVDVGVVVWVVVRLVVVVGLVLPVCARTGYPTQFPNIFTRWHMFEINVVCCKISAALFGLTAIVVYISLQGQTAPKAWFEQWF